MKAEQAHRLARINQETIHRKSIDVARDMCIEAINNAVDTGKFQTTIIFEGNNPNFISEIVDWLQENGFDVRADNVSEINRTEVWVGWVTATGQKTLSPVKTKRSARVSATAV